MHIEAKKLLKIYAFSLKSEVNVPSTRRVGIVTSFLLKSKWFDIVQYDSVAVLESASFSFILRIWIVLFSFKNFLSEFC